MIGDIILWFINLYKTNTCLHKYKLSHIDDRWSVCQKCGHVK